MGRGPAMANQVFFRPKPIGRCAQLGQFFLHITQELICEDFVKIA